MFTKESWNEYAHKKGGYVFRQVWDTKADLFHYDGYLATEGNKEQIDHENVPFIVRTGMLDQDALNSMVLFIEKDIPLTRESMWDAILDRRATGVLAERAAGFRTGGVRGLDDCDDPAVGAHERARPFPDEGSDLTRWLGALTARRRHGCSRVQIERPLPGGHQERRLSQGLQAV